MIPKNVSPSAGGPIADRICRAVIILEQSEENPLNAAGQSSETQKKRKTHSLERERQALNDLHFLLNGCEAFGRVPRHLLTNAVSALFQCLDHREQSLRFIADQTLDALFRKFFLKFQAEKVVAFLLSELNKRTNSARAICAALQKLSWTIGRAKAQRTNTFLTHLLNAIGICLQRPEESVHIAVEEHFPTIFAQIGPSFVATNHAEKAGQLLAIALENIELKGAKNRAAVVAIVQLAKFVPSIFHESFCALSKIVFESDQREHKMRLVGSLNIFRMLWPNFMEHLTENSQPILQKLLSKVLRCICCDTNELLVSALELLRDCAQLAVQKCPPNSPSLFDFNPLTVLSDHKITSDLLLNFPFDLPNDGRSGKNAAETTERQTIGDDAESVFSLGTAKMSAWSSLADLAAMDTSPQMEFGIEDLNTALTKIGINIETGDEIGKIGDKTAERESADEEEDKFSVISAELFVDPLMNCFHQQKMQSAEEEKRENSAETNNKTIIGQRQKKKTEEGADQCEKKDKIQQRNEGTKDANAGQRWDGMLRELSENVPLDSDGLTFWLHSSLSVARRFLLSGHRNLYGDGEMRISHKILAMEFLANAAMVEPKLASANCVVVHEDGHHQPISDLFNLAGHEDDNLAIAALKFAFNIGKWKLWKLASEQKLDSQQRHGTEERGRLAWLLKKTLHANRGPNRVKSVLRLCSQSLALFSCPFDDGQLLEAACECAISSGECDYFLVKNCRIEFLANIRWSRTFPKCRLRLQNVCLQLFLRHLFDNDPRVQTTARNAMPKLIWNLHFGDSSVRLPFTFPHCFEEEAHRQLPMLLGICSRQFPFKAQNSSAEHFLLAHNLAHFLHSLLSVAFANFSECQFGFVTALATLVHHFPPTTSEFSSVWLTSDCEIGAPPPFSRGQMLPNGHKLLFLLLECAESSCCSLNELNSLLQIIASLFAGISEGLLLTNFEFDGHGTNFGTQFLGIGQNMSDEAHSKQQLPLSLRNALLERVVLLLLRVFNLFYAVVAEERTLRTAKNASAAVSSAESAFATFLSRQMFLGPSHEKKSQEKSDGIGIGTAAAHSPKVVNFSFLIGSGIKPSRPTSFTHSDTLNSLEPSLKGAYKAFIEQLNPNSFGRFLEPLESAISAFCTLLEVTNLTFVRTFLDELLLYQRMLIDFSPANSARLIHQLLKCVFNTNAQNLNGKAMRQNEIWEQHLIQSDGPLERHLFGPLNNFTVFTAFVLRTEFADAFVARLSGWILPNRLCQFPSENAQVLGELLHQFEPFISHLLKLYPLTNSTDTKKAILDCVCSLCLCNVSYELLDRNGKFHARILGQLKQLSPVDDVPLLPNILAFLCVLERINFTKFSEIESVMTELFDRFDDGNGAFILEAMRIVLLSVCFNLERKGKRPEENLQCLTRLKTLLTSQFSRTFCAFPIVSAQCWIILMNDLRQHRQSEECWTDASLELFSLFADFCSRHCAVPSASHWHSFANSLPMNASNSADWTRQMFLFTFLFGVCSPTVFR
ncbi:hypothetical protein niasHS_014897 [Heterodera schachtii]|uniref:Huntingtin n=1 Tax=Heterodera schachtii TaxID=97005 RepID=A0ABD2IRQ0_HETSC